MVTVSRATAVRPAAKPSRPASLAAQRARRAASEAGLDGFAAGRTAVARLTVTIVAHFAGGGVDHAVAALVTFVADAGEARLDRAAVGATAIAIDVITVVADFRRLDRAVTAFFA